jgi:hypothetical protein
MRRVGVLTGFEESNLEASAFLSAFTQSLAELGWTDGRNVRIDVRWAAGSVDWARMFAKELVDLQPDVIFVTPGYRCNSAADAHDSDHICIFGRLRCGLTRPRREYHRLHRPTSVTGGHVAGIAHQHRARHQAGRNHELLAAIMQRFERFSRSPLGLA